MNFDFAAYLAKLDPRYAYRIDRLTGGVVNVTVRATKVAFAPASSNYGETLGMSGGHVEQGHGKFPGQKTLILKHAPPFIAGVGEDAPMPQDRQVHPCHRHCSLVHK